MGNFEMRRRNKKGTPADALCEQVLRPGQESIKERPLSSSLSLGVNNPNEWNEARGRERGTRVRREIGTGRGVALLGTTYVQTTCVRCLHV